jgi:hypothetical protein
METFLVALITLWVVGVILFWGWVSIKVVPLLRDTMENGTSEEKEKVRNALYPPRFFRD